MARRPGRHEAGALIFVDSSAWIDFFNGRPSAAAERLDGLLGQEELVLGDIVLTEVLQEFRRDRDFEQARRLLSGFEVIPVLGETLALRSARNYRALRQRGVTVRKTIDTLIATCCIERGFWLLHADRDFEPFERHLGLKVVH